ncbi:MAG: 4Fe-4S binding protein [Planctomycetota bacterium]|nr:4Fe-4S binding protein [Planctomycetota bacterium]MCX8040472.1 4Fe-4S binding protein [Planctomycetota bacterium]MDW8373220.1 4Fe-4S binding protein [Planctomycetota bacterium]
MPHIVNEETCTGCEACVPACPTNAIAMVDGKAKISEECVDCASCVEACPTQSIHPA